MEQEPVNAPADPAATEAPDPAGTAAEPDAPDAATDAAAPEAAPDAALDHEDVDLADFEVEIAGEAVTFDKVLEGYQEYIKFRDDVTTVFAEIRKNPLKYLEDAGIMTAEQAAKLYMDGGKPQELSETERLRQEIEALKQERAQELAQKAAAQLTDWVDDAATRFGVPLDNPEAAEDARAWLEAERHRTKKPLTKAQVDRVFERLGKVYAKPKAPPAPAAPKAPPPAPKSPVSVAKPPKREETDPFKALIERNRRTAR